MTFRKLIIYIITLFVISVGFFKSQSQSDFYISDRQGNQNLVIDCNYPLVNGNCVALSANYPSFKQTDNYAVSSINYTPYAVVNKTVIRGDLDDSFSGKINLPFKFCFYGQVYDHLVIGSNGMISFDIDQANQANPANFSAALPNQNLPKEAIFGVFHDMFFSESNGSEINYSVIGTAPYRKFVVNFRKGTISGCDSEASSSQIVLSEGSNNIEIFVENKPLACDLASVKNAVIGINDATGDLGLAAPGRNTGIWSAQNEAWLFTPNADSLTPKISWYDSNNNIIETNETNETNKNLTVCPTKNETYKVEIIYTNCNNEKIIYSDTINVNFAADYPLVKDYSKIFCNSTEQVILADYKSSIVTGDPSFFNFEFRDAVTNQILYENTPFTITSNRNIKVTVSNKNDANCKKVANLSFLSQNIYNYQPVICDFANDGVENNFLLSNLNSQLVGTDYQGTVSYFTSYNNAANNLNVITNYNLNNGTQFYIRLVQGGCVNVLGPIEVRFNSSPVVNNASLNVTICDNNADGAENFNWAENLNNKLTTTESGMSIRVFNTKEEAFTALSNQLGLTQIREGNYKVYARVQSASGCFSIAEVSMNVTFNSIEAKNVDKYICFDGNEDKTIDLKSYKNEMLVNPSDVPVAFFRTVSHAQSNLPSREISSTQIITDNGDYISKSFYARFSNGDCYTIKRIRIILVNLTVNNDKFKVCDIGNNGSERITLSKYTREINNQSGTRVAFYLSEPEARDGSTTGLRFLDLRSSSSSTVYARISLSDCVLVVPITFNLVRTPDIVTEIVQEFPIYCDNNSDGKENIDLTQLQPIINTNNELVEFSYFKSYNAQNGTFADPYSEPSNTEVQDGEILYVKVKYKDSDCFSVAKVTVRLPVINDVINLNQNAVLKICNEDFSVSEIFNLEEAVSQLFYQQNNNVLLDNLQITYYVNENFANQGTSAGKISVPSSYISTAANTYVYARFQSQYGCYSIAPINLLFVLPAKAINSEITICDNNLDGAYDVNLLAYKDSMVQYPNEDNKFKFYKEFADINVAGKEITNPENFIVEANTSKIWVYVESLPNCGSYAEINFKKGEVLTLGQKQYKIDNICDTNNDKKEIIDLTGFESSSSYTYEYYDNQSDLWLGKNKIQNPASYAYDGNSGDSTIYVKVSQGGFCPDFYTIDVILKTTPMIEIPDYYYCKNDMLGIEIRPNFNGLNVVNYHWEFPDGTIKDGVDYLTNIKTLGTYTLTLTNSLGCTYTTTFKVLNEETPRIVSLTGKNDYYTIKAEGIPGKKIVYSKDLKTWHDSNVFYNLEAGDYTFYVKYANSDCYGDSIKGKIFNLKNAFSPNGDGINDYWELTGLDVFSNNSTLQIFDRYGNMVYKEVSNTEFKWDGKANSRVLNSDTYWFVITAGDERIYKGWIYLKNKK